MKVIVVQRGARRRYAVPRMLHAAGCLEALYTDSCGSSGLGAALRRMPILPARLKRLRDRVVDGVPRERVRTTDLPLLAEPAWRLWTRNPMEWIDTRDRIFCSGFRTFDCEEADTLLSMMGEGRGLVVKAQEQGLRIAMDVYITPAAQRIVEKEQRKFPDWGEPSGLPTEELEAHTEERLRDADLWLCPSETVVDGLRGFGSFDERKVRLVPYGHALDVAVSIGEPVRGRVLFGGSADLRKGIHYYAEAARMLEGAGVECYAAGRVTERVRQRPEARAIRFLGPLRRGDFLREMRSAAVFLLPTLAEGSAGVVFEALCCGVPVVTTRSAGSVVTDGKEGRIVPERDPVALANAIKEIALDRDLRAAMSAEALKTAAEYTEEKWGERLVAALR